MFFSVFFFTRMFWVLDYLTYQGGSGERQEQLLPRSVSSPMGGTALRCLAWDSPAWHAQASEPLWYYMCHIDFRIQSTICYCTCTSCSIHTYVCILVYSLRLSWVWIKPAHLIYCIRVSPDTPTQGWHGDTDAARILLDHQVASQHNSLWFSSLCLSKLFDFLNNKKLPPTVHPVSASKIEKSWDFFATEPILLPRDSCHSCAAQNFDS